MRIENGVRPTVTDRAKTILLGMLVAEHVRSHAATKGDTTSTAEADLVIKEALAEVDSLGISTRDKAAVTAAKRVALGLMKGYERAGHPSPALAAAEIITMPVEDVIVQFGQRKPQPYAPPAGRLIR